MSGRSDFRAAPRVTVVMPFLDTPTTFLDEAVWSVLAQTFTDWELILVNDGSEPEATAAARRWVEAEPRRIRMLEHPAGKNRGIPASRNLALQEPGAPLVAFLDSDDVWSADRLAEHVSVLDRDPSVGMVYGRSVYWSSWDPETGSESGDFTPALGVPHGVPLFTPRLLVRFLRGEAAIPCPSAVTARRSALERVGGFEARRNSYYEDQFLYSKLILDGPVAGLDRVLTRYRVHGGSLTGAADATTRKAARREYLEWLAHYVAAKGVRDPVLGRAVRGELMALEHPVRARVLRTARRFAFRVRGLVGEGKTPLAPPRSGPLKEAP